MRAKCGHSQTSCGHSGIFCYVFYFVPGLELAPRWIKTGGLIAHFGYETETTAYMRNTDLGSMVAMRSSPTLA